ncbi:AMP-binding protein [Pseudokineococcus lusitanus]|uniref:O-succinylbenzoic acid--CoA ligase n=1 Tax=Pseudokineococcus lusitanus TaxID=763993 RepID=A0A3N1HLD4_9ACTN|nr:AMP-binding protein [Pseudokineococcus lusitanus]ROP43271.1 O-succinylbenzoic acid--CoA ligase [Pseudokineococcus lusitanus]
MSPQAPGVLEVPVDAAAAGADDPDGWAAGAQELLARRLRAGAPVAPSLLPLPGGPGDDALRAAARDAGPAAAGAVLLLPTSGSTGAPRLVPLGADAVRAGARGGEAVLGGPASWLLCLPLAHVAGWNVLARGAVAGTVPAALPPGTPFTADAFVAAAERLLARAPGPVRTSLVPTQLVRLLEDPGGRRVLAALDAVLLGGAAAPPSLLAAAADAGARVVRTYGATETCGGCVYDGVPLPGVEVALEDDGRVLLGGDVLALDQPVRAGTRWTRTADAGRWVDDPAARGGRRLEVLGRLDDVLVTGGEKVAPAAVEAVLAGAPGVREVLVVGVPDERWGQAVVAVVVPAPGGPAPDLAALRAAAAAALGRAAAPRRLVLVDDLPRRALGKPDRRAAAALAAAADGPPPGGG